MAGADEHRAAGRPDPEHRTEPVRAWKVARISPVGAAGWRYRGLRLVPGNSYRTVDEAICLHDGRHQPPAFECDCGFWAVPSPDDLTSAVGDLVDPACALLEVDLSGTLVEHEHDDGRLGGWRASHQTVLRVRFDRRCAGCGEPAKGFAERERFVVPACGTCRGAGPVRWSVADVAGRLGTEVELAELGGVSRRAPAAERRSKRLVFALVPAVPLGTAAALLFVLAPIAFGDRPSGSTLDQDVAVVRSQLTGIDATTPLDEVRRAIDEASGGRRGEWAAEDDGLVLRWEVPDGCITVTIGTDGATVSGDPVRCHSLPLPPADPPT